MYQENILECIRSNPVGLDVLGENPHVGSRQTECVAPRGQTRVPVQVEFIGKNSRELQRDFSSLTGPVGIEWSELMGRKQLVLTDMCVLRVTPHPFGLTRDRNENLVAGGMEVHIQLLSEALVALYPVQMHVVAPMSPGLPEREVRTNAQWRGEIVVHRIPNLFLRPNQSTPKVMSIAAEVGAQVLHLHDFDKPLAVRLAREATQAGIGVAVTHHYGAVMPPLGETASNTASYARRVFRHFVGKVKEQGFYAGTSEFALDVLEQVRRRYVGVESRREEMCKLVDKSSRLPFNSCQLITISDPSRSVFRGHQSLSLGVPMDPDFFDPANVCSEEIERLRDVYGIRPDEPVVVYHARITPNKGQKHIVEVARTLRDRYEQSVKVLFLGTVVDPQYCRELDALCRQYQLGNQVKILPAVDQLGVRSHLALASLFLFPPCCEEGLGRSGLDALLMKKPVIAYNRGGLHEYVKDGVTGYLVGPNNTEKMAELTFQLLQEPARIVEMGEQGRQLVSLRYHAKKLAQEYMNVVYAPQLQVAQ
ncbi:MAG: glycosyltransferase family 4 protein [Bdellovibrionales bacterium]|nr:glycosyltransferase family 4 protein [Bdellovibrionales bacterium]